MCQAGLEARHPRIDLVRFPYRRLILLDADAFRIPIRNMHKLFRQKNILRIINKVEFY